jgi:outer membrane lipoprotein-sorting protein
MKKWKVVLLGALPLISLPATAQTADQVIAKALAARGGVEKIKAVQSERISGNISFGPGAEGPFTVEFKRPSKMRMEITIQGKTVFRTYDGKSGWKVNPFEGNSDPQPMSADDLKNIAAEADMDGPFVDYKAKGNQVELAEKENISGKDTYKLKLTLANGEVRYYYVAANSYLLTKWEGKRIDADGKEFGVESFFSDYHEAGGLMFAYLIESDTPGTERKQKIVIDKIEVNAPEDDARFTMATAKPADSKPAEAKPQ